MQIKTAQCRHSKISELSNHPSACVLYLNHTMEPYGMIRGRIKGPIDFLWAGLDGVYCMVTLRVSPDLSSSRRSTLLLLVEFGVGGRDTLLHLGNGGLDQGHLSSGTE